MRGFVPMMGALVFAACGSGSMPNQFTMPAPAQPFECVSRHAGTLGYRVISQTPGEVRLERENERLWVLNLLGINDTADVLVATTQGTANQVNISGYSQVIRGGERTSAPPSREVLRDAHEIVGVCST